MHPPLSAAGSDTVSLLHKSVQLRLRSDRIPELDCISSPGLGDGHGPQR